MRLLRRYGRVSVVLSWDGFCWGRLLLQFYRVVVHGYGVFVVTGLSRTSFPVRQKSPDASES